MSGIDYTGQVINGITFVERLLLTYGTGRRTYSRWKVICRCGGEFKATAHEIRSGRACGWCHAVRQVPRFGALASVENEVLLELAKTGTRTDVAKALSEKLGCTVTKNMVTGRLWRIGATTPRPLPKTAPPWLPPAGACTFPLGHPGDGDFRYCGDVASEGRVYCDRHHKLTHLKESLDERRTGAL